MTPTSTAPREQMKDELKNLLTFIAWPVEGLRSGRLLSGAVHQDPHKYVGSGIWEEATNTLKREVRQESGLELIDDPCGASLLRSEDFRAGS